MEALAIIPARGGSKGIPRKNIAMLCGRPLMAWTIEAAQRSSWVNRVVVSTDDTSIAAVGRQFGAEVVGRPAALSNDTASSEAALLHTLQRLEADEGYRPDLVAFMQCTSPLTIAADVDGTIAVLIQQQADTALAVSDFHHYLWRREADDLVGINHEKRERLPRQQRAADYLESGAVYVMRSDGFLHHRHRFFGRTAHYLMPRERCWEIDEPVDLRIAEVLLREQLRARRTEALPDPVAALVLDFDGVFTDNRVLVQEDGREAVFCSRGDGIALAELQRSELPMLVLSSERNPVVAARCRKLEIECIHGVQGKYSALRKWLATRQIDMSQVVYVGNDVNDLDCLQAVGCGVVVSDAYEDVKSAARIVLTSPGGGGAIRELAELVQSRIQPVRGRRYARSA